MNDLLALLREASLPLLCAILLAENLVVFASSLALGHLAVRAFAGRRIAEPPAPVTGKEVGLVALTILLNTAVTVAGCLMWRAGVVRFRSDVGAAALLDAVALVLVMDLLMYALHRAAHIPLLYPIVHGTHHGFRAPRPLSLFALNPAEAVGFGLLWLGVITLFDFSWLGIVIYLVLNVAFGTIGHLGVEPFPDAWASAPVARYVSTSSFHAQHHGDERYNFGFYTLLWDKLFGTLAPDYGRDFGRPRASASIPNAPERFEAPSARTRP